MQWATKVTKIFEFAAMLCNVTNQKTYFDVQMKNVHTVNVTEAFKNLLDE